MIAQLINGRKKQYSELEKVGRFKGENERIKSK